MNALSLATPLSYTQAPSTRTPAAPTAAPNNTPQSDDFLQTLCAQYSSSEPTQPAPPPTQSTAQKGSSPTSSVAIPQLQKQTNSLQTPAQPDSIPADNNKTAMDDSAPAPNPSIKDSKNSGDGAGDKNAKNSGSAQDAPPLPSREKEPHIENETADCVALSVDATAALAANPPASNNVAAPNGTNRNQPASSPVTIEAPDITQPASLLTAQPVFGDLAFALRVSSKKTSESDTSDNDCNPAPKPATSNSASNSLFAATVATVAQNNERKPDTSQNIVATAAITDHRAQNSEAQSTAPAEAAAPAPAADFEAELNKFRAAEPVRGAHVQISGPDSQRVDLRLVERNGALSVTVRSADSSLARTLQDHAPELNTRLNLEHFRTELWTPQASRANFQQSSGNSSSNSSSSGGGNPNQQQQNRKQRQQPAWIDEIETQSTALKKRIEYTWQ